MTWDQVKEATNQLAESRGDWAGYPLPVAELPLRLAKSHPLYGTLDGVKLDEDGDMLRVSGEIEDDPEFEFVNMWYSRKKHGWVTVIRDRATGLSHVSRDLEGYPAHRLAVQIHTVIPAERWDLSAELTAQARLRHLVKPHLWEIYLMTGLLIETSRRSGLVYVFRRLRPTVVLRPDDRNGYRLLTTLCLHSLAYYAGSFCGALVPTDDVIAHLLLMRGDEPKFWAKANQHDPWSPLSGI